MTQIHNSEKEQTKNTQERSNLIFHSENITTSPRCLHREQPLEHSRDKECSLHYL